MNTRDVLEGFSKSGVHVFTVYDFAKAIGKPVGYASLLLHNNDKAAKIEKGVYYIDGATDYEIASNIVFPSYVSMQAGMQYYGLIDQNIIRYSVITPERHSELDVRGISIEFISTRRSLFFGYERKGNEYVAKVEKLFIDSLYFGRVPEWMLNEAFKSAFAQDMINEEVMKQYYLRLKGITNTRALRKRIRELTISAVMPELANDLLHMETKALPEEAVGSKDVENPKINHKKKLVKV